MKTNKHNYPSLGAAIPAGHTATRHDPMQRTYREVIVEPTQLNEQIDRMHLPPQENEMLLTYQQELCEYIIEEAPKVLTSKQWAVLQLWLTGRYTQQQIGDMTGSHQTSIHKILNGNDVYAPDGSKVRHGGVLRKLTLWAKDDIICQYYINRIKEIEDQ